MEDYFQYIGGTVGLVALTGAAAATTIYKAFSATPATPVVDLNNQSFEIPNSNGARQSLLAPPGGFTSFVYEDAQTVYEIIHRGLKISGNGNCLGYKISKTEYAWISYKEVIERFKNISSGLVYIGMESGQNSFIGIYSQNCAEWVLTEYACYSQSAVTIPLYDTLGPDTCSFIINQAEIKIVVCDKEEKAKSLLKKKDDTPCLKHIIVVNGFSNETKQLALEKGVELRTLKEIKGLGMKNPVDEFPPEPEDIATICYTSGTTGEPKGIKLTHANFIFTGSAIVKHLGDYAFDKNDVMISFLPLAHMFERICEMSIFTNGGSVGYFGGDVKSLMDDLKALRPTIIPAVPRFLNKIYDKVIAGANSSLMKRLIFNLAMKIKKKEIEKLVIRNDSVWDHIVFKPLRDSMGGRARLVVSGAAPLSGDVLTFLRCALGCVVIEGYGQTECTGPCTISIPGDYTVGHVGPPISSCHIKLVDVPEMECYAKDKKGEICLKGLNLFKGYFKNESKTKEAIDSDGWMHTGDIGMWLPNGSLKIVDRRKHMFKLSQGEYIAPEKIENIYLASPYVSQIFVHGESLQSFLVAVVVPDKEILLPWCKEKCIEGTWEEICRNKVVKDLILNDITNLGKSLKSFEQVKDIYVYSGIFTVENGLLTPTFKTKRLECKKYFTDVIEGMYRSMK